MGPHQKAGSVSIPGLNGVAGPCASAAELVKLAPQATTIAKTRMRTICILLLREAA
jgi:hypothetical protein